MARLWEYLERLDWTLLAAAFTLAAVGLVAIYGIGVSQEPSDLFLFHKQFVTFAIGVATIAVLIFLDYRHLRSYGLMLYIFGAVLLAGVLFFGVRINATQGWFRFGALSFQPVEIAKVTLAVYLAAFFVRRGRGRLSWTTFGISFVATSDLCRPRSPAARLWLGDGTFPHLGHHGALCRPSTPRLAYSAARLYHHRGHRLDIRPSALSTRPYRVRSSIRNATREEPAITPFKHVLPSVLAVGSVKVSVRAPKPAYVSYQQLPRTLFLPL
jgi:hypothetical protein